MTLDEFVIELGCRIARLGPPGEWSLDRIDSRTVGVIADDGDRFILDIEAVDEQPHPLIALLDRRQPDVPPGLTHGETVAPEMEAGVVDTGPVCSYAVASSASPCSGEVDRELVYRSRYSGKELDRAPVCSGHAVEAKERAEMAGSIAVVFIESRSA